MPDHYFLGIILPRLHVQNLGDLLGLDGLSSALCPLRSTAHEVCRRYNASEINSLLVQLMKNEDMPSDFRHSHVSPGSAVTAGQVVGRVKSRKNRGTTADNGLTLEFNTAPLLLRKLLNSMLNMFHRSFVELVLTLSFIC